MHVVDTLKYFLNSVSPFGTEADMRMICLLLLGVLRTKDGLSLIIVQNKRDIAVIGLNFAGAGGRKKGAKYKIEVSRS